VVGHLIGFGHQRRQDLHMPAVTVGGGTLPAQRLAIALGFAQPGHDLRARVGRQSKIRTGNRYRKITLAVVKPGADSSCFDQKLWPDQWHCGGRLTGVVSNFWCPRFFHNPIFPVFWCRCKK
jgi:hypothetical protein